MNILVTGASRGIGLAIAQELSEIGDVYGVSRNDEDLKKLAIKGYYACDLADKSSLEGLGQFIEENKFEMVINNAGYYSYSQTENLAISDLEKTIDINLKAPIFLIKKAIPYMKTVNFGRIVNIGSISGVMGECGACVYSATKAGLIGLSKAVGLELAQFGITVNTINPGWVDTDLGNASIEDGEFTKDEILECIPQRRFVTPQEIAKLVRYLVSPDAKGVTGQSINLCAGLSVGI